MKFFIFAGTLSGLLGGTLAAVMSFFSVYMIALLLLSVRKRQPSGTEPYYPRVSILIPAHNEEAVIARTVRALLNQTYQNTEVIVIDDASSDQTPHVLWKLQQEYPGLRVLRRELHQTRGKPAALNDALALATGDIIAVFDADSYVRPDFISRVVPHLFGRHVAGVQAKVRMYNRNENAWTMVQDSEFAIYCSVIQAGRDRLRGYCGLGGNGQFVKRAALVSVGGWAPGTLAEDFDLTLSLLEEGWIVRYVDEPVYQEAVSSFRALFRQRNRWSQGGLQSTLRHFVRIIRSQKVKLRTKLDTVLVFSMVLQPMILVASFVVSMTDFRSWRIHWPSFSLSSAWQLFMLVSFVVFIVAGHLIGKREDWRWLPIHVPLYYVYSFFWPVLYIWSIVQFAAKRGRISWAKTNHASETFSA